MYIAAMKRLIAFVATALLMRTIGAVQDLNTNQILSAKDFTSVQEECEAPSTTDASSWQTSTLTKYGFTDERRRWYLNRGPFEPIVGDSNLIAGVLFTISEGKLKLSVYFPPLHPRERRNAILLVEGNGVKRRKKKCHISALTWHCTFIVENINDAKTWKYRVVYRPKKKGKKYVYSGQIPKQVGYPRIAALGCFGFDNTKNKSKLVEAVLDTKPDLLVLSGDQTYLHDHLVLGFLELVYTINELTRSRPTIVQMDDHDYAEGNIWGAGLNTVENDDSGKGFLVLPVCFINAVQRMMMGHDPEPATDATLDNGITIHYTNYVYGNVDFAVLEARKFKNKKTILGSGQEQWLKGWCSDRDLKKRLKVVLAQTPFYQLGTEVTNYKPDEMGTTIGAKENVDTNGGPREGWERAMDILSGCTPLIISGDQHLSIAVEYEGKDIVDCASPAAINDIWWRMNQNEVGKSHTDGWEHPYKLLAVWNVDKKVIDDYGCPKLTRTSLVTDEEKALRADGFLIVDMDGTKASCEGHGYRVGHRVRWRTTFKAQAKDDEGNDSPAGYCFKKCTQNATWICDGCITCPDRSAVCENLCGVCRESPFASNYGGLVCDCPQLMITPPPPPNPVSPTPSVAGTLQEGFCYKACTDPKPWVCTDGLGCLACNPGDVCEGLCNVCKAAGQYGGLNCACDDDVAPTRPPTHTK